MGIDMVYGGIGAGGLGIDGGDDDCDKVLEVDGVDGPSEH